MTIITRSEWDAEPAKYVARMADSVLGWIVHYNGPALPPHMTGEQAMQSIQRYHQHTKGWSDFAYSFGIDQDGSVFEGRGWFVVGGHTSGTFMDTGLSNNRHAHAVIFLIGEGQAPTQAALDAFADLVADGVQRGVPARTTPHKVAATHLGTLCPGAELTAITKSGYFLDTHKEPGIAMKETVRQLYINLLGREPDEAGQDYWVEQLESKAATLDYVRWEFVRVRLAADDARIKALAAKQSQSGSGGPSAEVVAEQAFRLFIDNLIALR